MTTPTVTSQSAARVALDKARRGRRLGEIGKDAGAVEIVAVGADHRKVAGERRFATVEITGRAGKELDDVSMERLDLGLCRFCQRTHEACLLKLYFMIAPW